MTPRRLPSTWFGVCLVCMPMAAACESGLKANRDGGTDEGVGRGPDGGPDGGPGASQDVPAAPTDGAGCWGLELPDVDCAYGTPSYVCVPSDGGWSWGYTCPDRPDDAGWSRSDTGDTVSNCAAIAQRLLREMQTGVGACTAVVRLDYTTLDILSYAFVCGKYSATDEASARSSATATAAFPYSGGAGTGNLLSGPPPTDQWVFYTPPIDFGGVAAVSDLTGLTTFAATIIWSGRGEILFPKSFSTADLGRGCEVPPPSSVRGISLASDETQSRFQEAASIVRSTALPAAFTGWGGTFDAVALVYPRTVGGFEATSAEYIVLLDGGWLE
jgi:hypothetical protein